MTTELLGSMKEIAEADKVYGLMLVQDGKDVRLEQVNVKNRYGEPEPSRNIVVLESSVGILYRIIRS